MLIVILLQVTAATPLQMLIVILLQVTAVIPVQAIVIVAQVMIMGTIRKKLSLVIFCSVF